MIEPELLRAISTRRIGNWKWTVHIKDVPHASISVKSALVEELTSAFVRTCNGARERVTVIIEEIPKQHWGLAGKVVGAVPAATTLTGPSAG